jgi:hypothetical protein
VALGAVFEWVLGHLAGFVGLEGLAIGAVASLAVASYYAREVSGVLVVAARYLNVVTYLLLSLLVVLVVGTATGIVDLSAGGSVIGQLIRGLGAVL